MKIKHLELVIPEDNPFANCKLGREKYATVLTDIVNTFPDGFVLAVNNEWGTGKTTFIKMWEQHLKNQGFQTIYFNAWENDFDGNPLVALMAELKTLTKSNSKRNKLFKSVVEKGAVLAKNALPAVAKGLVKRYVDTEALLDGVEGVMEDVGKNLQDRIKEYTKKKESIAGFRKELEKFVNEPASTKPLIFIIDELDRCRPDYAVEVLEQMKHFFSVSGIVFVLSIDKYHLAASVRGYYGSESINADEYLRRFIDLEYSIPKPPVHEFTNYLYNYYAFDEFLGSQKRMSKRQFHSDGTLLRTIAQLLFEEANATLRQQEKIFAHARLVLRAFNDDNHTFSYLLFVLVYIKTLKRNLYTKIEERSLTNQQLLDAFAELFGENIDIQEVKGINLGYVEALLLYFYHNQFETTFDNALYTVQGDEIQSEVTSKLNPSTGERSLIQLLQAVENEWEFRGINISYLLRKINLTDPLVIQDNN